MDAIEKETPNLEAKRKIEHGDGPRIEGTRISVYAILEYLRAGRSRDYIAAALFLSSAQVQAAIDYIHEHEAEVISVFGASISGSESARETRRKSSPNSSRVERSLMRCLRSASPKRLKLA